MPDPAPTTVHDDLAGIIGEVVGRPAEEIGPGQALADVGVDSLAMLEVVLGVERVLGVRIEDADVSRLTTYDALAAYVEQRVSA